MISLEQVQLLEAKVSKAIEYVQQVNSENATLISERASLQKKLDANQKRIDELEVLVMRFKEDQGRIEDGIIAALDRLSQFEEAFENSLKEKTPAKKTAAKVREKASDQDQTQSEASSPVSKEIFFEISEKETVKNDKSLKGDLSPKGDSSEGELDIF
jgi:FtsZ-binding cell division protein ZapB